jgi:hypothetical protein
MALPDNHLLLRLGLPLPSEGIVDVLVELASGIVGNVQQLNGSTLSSRARERCDASTRAASWGSEKP